MLAVLLSWPAGAALAGPVAPDPVKLVQPDGTVIVAQPFGDEYYSGYEYQGYTILLDPASGYWVYARQAQNGELVASSWKVGIDKPPANLPPHLRDSQAVEAVPTSGLRLGPDVWPGSSGTQPVLVLLVDFTPSTSRGTTEAQWSQLFFDATPGVKSVRNYYWQASFDQLDLQPAAESYGATDDGVIAVNLGYVRPSTYPIDVANRQIVRDALIAANSYINYGSFDTNGNGSLDGTELHLVIIVRGFETSYGNVSGACAPNVWGHRGALWLGDSVVPPTLDGVVIGANDYNHGYSQVGEWHEFLTDGCDGGYPGHMATMGIMVHEMGHDIDWPDLYDTDSSSSGVGYWSIMGSGSWGRASSSEFIGTTPSLPDAFLKWYQRWITPTPVTTPLAGVALPNAAQNPVAYLLGVNPGGIDWDFRNASGTGEYFLIENRQQVGFDTGLWRIDSVGNARGCLIWHIDETRISNNTANANEARRLVDLEEANGTQNLDLPNISGGNSGDIGDPWPGSTGNTAFNGISTPHSNWHDGTTSGIAVTSISPAGMGCTVDFSGAGPTWDGSDGSNWDTADNWTTARVPNSNDNVVVPAGVSNWPGVNVAASVGNLNIMDGAHVTAGADVALNVYGDWAEAGSGYFEASAGTVNFVGNFAQSITAGVNSLL